MVNCTATRAVFCQDHVMGSSALRLVIIDDHPAILAGLETTLNAHLPDLLGIMAGPDISILDGVDATDVDVVLLDVRLGDGSDPPSTVAHLVARGFAVILYTQDERRGVVSRCFRAGASGIVPKHAGPPELVEAIRTVAAGRPWLSREWAAALEGDPTWEVPSLAPREIEAIQLYSVGLPLKSVARRMGVSQETVREYLLRARRKYSEAGRSAGTKSDLYFLAVEDGHLPQGRPSWP